MKKFLPLLLIIFAVLLSGCGKKTTTDSTDDTGSNGNRLVVNQLDQTKRPFVLLSEHSSNKLLAFYLQNSSSLKEATVDIEYLSGDLLKGARSTLSFPLSDPYAQAFLLGSCSAGGKCSFDQDLISGSLKLRLDVKGESDTHVLKADYLFVTGDVSTSDGRVSYEPASTSGNQILLNTIGLPEKLDNILLYPIAITTTNSNSVKGELSISQKNVKAVKLFDGRNYNDLAFKDSGDQISISLDEKPWSKTVDIVRDDLKGAEESQTFYILGPIVLIGE